MANKILIQESRRSGLSGIVEENNGCVYLYAYERGSVSIVGTCWICNTKRAPRVLKYGLIEKGIQPRMPAIYCDHPKGMKLDAGKLSLQWSTDNDILVLRHDKNVMGVIYNLTKRVSVPYSLHCTGETPFARSLETLPDKVKDLLNLYNEQETLEKSDAEAEKKDTKKKVFLFRRVKGDKSKKEEREETGPGKETGKEVRTVKVVKEKKRNKNETVGSDISNNTDSTIPATDAGTSSGATATDGQNLSTSDNQNPNNNDSVGIRDSVGIGDDVAGDIIGESDTSSLNTDTITQLENN